MSRMRSVSAKFVRSAIQFALKYSFVFGVAIAASTLFLVASARPVLAVDAPNLLEPHEGAETDASHYGPLGIPSFSWSAVDGTKNYRIQIARDAGFATIIVDVTTPNTEYTPISAKDFSDGYYYWHVRVDTPTASPYSETRSFQKKWAEDPSTQPALFAPNDDATLDFYDAPVFSWQAVRGVARYSLQIAANPDFSPVMTTWSTVDVSVQPTAKIAGGDYYWRVVPLDPNDHQGMTSQVRQVHFRYNQIPVPVGPANGSNPTFTPTFSWTAKRGASSYDLQYSTDQYFNNTVTSVTTVATTYTPIAALPNDVNYYWRVRSRSGSMYSDWSVVWSFMKKWYIQPQLLTPTNNFQYVSEPFFSWTPVPGAKAYKVEVSYVNGFPPPTGTCKGFVEASVVNTYYVKPQFPWECNYPNPWYWRVTPIDGSGNLGRSSDVFSFVDQAYSLVPRLVAPAYYYTPIVTLDTVPPEGFKPARDLTAPIPLFTWHRLLQADNLSEVPAYRLQVSDTPNFGAPVWSIDTRNTSAAATGSEWSPTPGGTFFWRVCALDAVGGNPIGPWSQVWKTRIDTRLISQNLRPKEDGPRPNIPIPLEPVSGDESLEPNVGPEYVELTPVFQWLEPRHIADRKDNPNPVTYSVEISTDPTMQDPASIVASAQVRYPVWTPALRLPFGTYYWRVISNPADPIPGHETWKGDCGSDKPCRFQVAAASHRHHERVSGDPANRLLIASDTSGDTADAGVDLTELYGSQDASKWYFGFKASLELTAPDALFVLLIDLDHLEGSGAPVAPMLPRVNILPAHRPEYAVYAFRQSGVFDPAMTFVTKWDPSTGFWGTPSALDSIGGAVALDAINGVVEFALPNTAIGMQEATGSASLVLLDALSGLSDPDVVDTVPSDPAVPGLPGQPITLSRLTSISERLAIASPGRTSKDDNATFAQVPPFAWHAAFDVPWCGYEIQFHKDSQFTSQVAAFTVWDSSTNPPPYSLIPPDYTHVAGDLTGDNKYYWWRERPMYWVPQPAPAKPKCEARGAWSQGAAFERKGFVPDIQPPANKVTPTLSWNMVEGAKDYDVQWDDDPTFATPTNATTTQTSFTPTGALSISTYYVRVRATREGVENSWPITAFSFTPAVPPPALIGPNETDPNHTFAGMPALCWTPLMQSENGRDFYAAYKYRVEISKDSTFSTTNEKVDTEQACYTPLKGYEDATYYWRVSVLHGTNPGTPSAPAQFSKRYPSVDLLEPTNGSLLQSTPTFSWSAVTGAAAYKLVVSTDVNFGTAYESVTTNNTRYTPTKTYAGNQKYYWRVAIVDDDGKVGTAYSLGTITIDKSFYKFLPVLKQGAP